MCLGACNFRERRWNAGCRLRVLCYWDGTLGDLSVLVPGSDAPVRFSGIRRSDTFWNFQLDQAQRVPVRTNTVIPDVHLTS